MNDVEQEVPSTTATTSASSQPSSGHSNISVSSRHSYKQSTDLSYPPPNPPSTQAYPYLENQGVLSSNLEHSENQIIDTTNNQSFSNTTKGLNNQFQVPPPVQHANYPKYPTNQPVNSQPPSNQSVSSQPPRPPSNQSVGSQPPRPPSNQSVGSQPPRPPSNQSVGSQPPRPPSNQSVSSQSHFHRPPSNQSNSSQPPRPSSNQSSSSQHQRHPSNHSLNSHHQRYPSNSSVSSQPQFAHSLVSQNQHSTDYEQTDYQTSMKPPNCIPTSDSFSQHSYSTYNTCVPNQESQNIPSIDTSELQTKIPYSQQSDTINKDLHSKNQYYQPLSAKEPDVTESFEKLTISSSHDAVETHLQQNNEMISKEPTAQPSVINSNTRGPPPVTGPTGIVSNLKARKGSPFQPPIKKHSINQDQEIPLAETSSQVNSSYKSFALNQEKMPANVEQSHNTGNVNLWGSSEVDVNNSNVRLAVASDRSVIPNNEFSSADHNMNPVPVVIPGMKIKTEPISSVDNESTSNLFNPPLSTHFEPRGDGASASNSNTTGNLPNFSRMVPGESSKSKSLASTVNQSAPSTVPAMPSERVVTGNDNPQPILTTRIKQEPQEVRSPPDGPDTGNLVDNNTSVVPPIRSATIGSEETSEKHYPLSGSRDHTSGGERNSAWERDHRDGSGRNADSRLVNFICNLS